MARRSTESETVEGPVETHVLAALSLADKLNEQEKKGWPGGFDVAAIKSQWNLVLDILNAVVMAGKPNERDLRVRLLCKRIGGIS